MEKSRAIELLKLAVPIKALTPQEYSDFVEAVNMGMDALEQPTTSDTISRQAAIDRFNVIRPVDPKKDEYTKGIDGGIAMCIVAVKDQPTFQPVTTDTNVGNNSEIPNSSDVISRQAALEKVRTMQTYKLFMGDDMILVDKADVQTELMMLPSAKPEPLWIPVERELPEPRIDVWVNSDLGQMTGYYDETVELWYGRDYLELIVNAWMPLPAPYQKGAKD